MPPDAQPETRTILPDLAELCRIHDVSLELIESSHDLDGLLGRVLEEYERRLGEMAVDTLDQRLGPRSDGEARKLCALVMFAAQAVALKTKAAAAGRVRQRAAELETLNDELERALAREEQSRRRLDDVLATLEAGILIVGADGTIQHANRAACSLTGAPPEGLIGTPIERLVAGVERGADGEVVSEQATAEPRVLLVARRNLSGEPPDEVVLFSDVTRRDREVAERHRLERLGELMRTLAALSHKINNPLTALLGRAQILRMKSDTDPQVRKASEVIEESAKRIADYIRELAHVVREGRAEALERLLEIEGPAPRAEDA